MGLLGDELLRTHRVFSSLRLLIIQGAVKALSLQFVVLHELVRTHVIRRFLIRHILAHLIKCLNQLFIHLEQRVLCTEIHLPQTTSE